MIGSGKMTVMHLVNSYALAGAEKLIFDLAVRMNRDKFEILVCSVGSKGDVIEAKLRRELEARDVATLSLCKPSRKRRVGVVWKLRRYLKANHVDILHTHCSSPNFYGKIAAFLAQTPFVFTTVHSVQGYSAMQERVFSHMTSGYIVISEAVREYTSTKLRISPRKVRVIYNAIDIDKFTAVAVDREAKLKELGISSGGRVITSVGSITERKGHVYLIEAAEELLKDSSDVYLLLIGDDHAEPELARSLKETVRAHRMQDRVLFTGVRADIPEILSITDVFVLPSLWEGFSLALIEGMATGIPVVTTSTGIAPEVVIDGVSGLIVPFKDSQALTQRIKELLGDSERARKLGAEGQRIVKERFDINRMVAEYEQVYLACGAGL